MKKRNNKKMKEHLDHFHIAGFTYYDGAEAFKELEIGTLLRIELEPNNSYDPRAVKICYKDYHLGYVPRGNNRIFYKLLKVGIDAIEVRIQRINGQEHTEEQVGVVAHLLANKQEDK